MSISLPDFRADPRLAGHQLGDVRLAVVTSDDHPWRGRSLISTAELRGQPVLIGHASSLTRRLLEPALRAGGFGLDITLESGNATTLVALARAGLGVAVVADDKLAADDSTSWPALVDEHSPMSAPLWIYSSGSEPWPRRCGPLCGTSRKPAATCTATVGAANPAERQPTSAGLAGHE